MRLYAADPSRVDLAILVDWQMCRAAILGLTDLATVGPHQ